MKKIYLQIHYQFTKQAIAEHIKKYNAATIKEYEESPEDFRLKHGLSKKSTFRAVIIKASVEATVFGILDMYAKFLQRNENAQVEEPVFKITNKAIATKRNGLYCKKTAHLHIKRATDAGIFDKNKYVFHGTNSGFQIGFNTSLLVSCLNKTYTDLLVDNYLNSVDKSLITQEKLTALTLLRPLFSDANNGCIVTNCNHIIVPVLLLEQNIYMDKAFSVENNLLPQIDSTQKQFNDAVPATGTIREQGSISQGFSLSSIALNFVSGSTKRLEQRLGGRAAEKVPKNEDMELLKFHVSASLKLILNVLYKDKILSDEDIQLATKDLQQYFRRTASGKTIRQLSDDLFLAVMEAHKSQRRKGFIPAPLYKYLDVYFKGGLLSTTLEHVERTVKPYIQKNKEITDSINATSDFYELFVRSNNNSEVYRKATQNLNKKKVKTYLDFFNQAVVEHKNFNKQLVYQTLTSQ